MDREVVCPMKQNVDSAVLVMVRQFPQAVEVLIVQMNGLGVTEDIIEQVIRLDFLDPAHNILR